MTHGTASRLGRERHPCNVQKFNLMPVQDCGWGCGWWLYPHLASAYSRLPYCQVGTTEISNCFTSSASPPLQVPRISYPNTTPPLLDLFLSIRRPGWYGVGHRLNFSRGHCAAATSSSSDCSQSPFRPPTYQHPGLCQQPLPRPRSSAFELPCILSLLHRDSMATSNNASLTTSPPRPQLDSHHILQYGPPLRTDRHASDSSSASSGEAAMRSKMNFENRPAAYSSSSQNTQGSGSTRGKNVVAQRAVKSIPRRPPYQCW